MSAGGVEAVVSHSLVEEVTKLAEVSLMSGSVGQIVVVGGGWQLGEGGEGRCDGAAFVDLVPISYEDHPVENVLNDKNRNKNKFKSSSSLGKRKGRRENNVGSCKKVKQSTAGEEIRGFLDFCENQNPSTFCSGVLDDVTTDLDDEQALLLTDILTLNSGLEEGGGFDEGFWSLEGNLGFERASHQMGILDNTSTEILDLEDGLSYDEMLEILCSDDDGDMSIEEFLQLLADIRRFEGHDEENEGAQLYGYLNHK
ncbi:hypothetical protein D5086_016685 [Populus alba]|uniref:Uncharacterized protein n=1 Tax=Populus alba TaxID=43335 RepID=A0ACC4BUN3_POPAL